jgi:hypothetical protein
LQVLLQLQAADVVTFASSSASRTVTLKGAKQEFKEFLSVCDDLDLLSVKYLSYVVPSCQWF